MQKHAADGVEGHAKTIQEIISNNDNCNDGFQLLW